MPTECRWAGAVVIAVLSVGREAFGWATPIRTGWRERSKRGLPLPRPPGPAGHCPCVGKSTAGSGAGVGEKTADGLEERLRLVGGDGVGAVVEYFQVGTRDTLGDEAGLCRRADPVVGTGDDQGGAGDLVQPAGVVEGPQEVAEAAVEGLERAQAAAPALVKLPR